MRPFLKWAGNKHAVAERIRALLPDAERLIEPFCGSAAVFLGSQYPSALLADSNADLIGLYQVLQEEGEGFIAYCATLFTPDHNTPEVYYSLRDEFNRISDKKRKSAIFLYLNRHGYNGLCRYNASGGFNVPMGRYVKPYYPVKEMRAFLMRARHVQFKVADFRDVMAAARPGDVIYCDPPYVPLSRTANFTGYYPGEFGPQEQQMLASLAEALAARGVPVVISNHDTSFTIDAYRNAVLTHFTVRRLISSKAHRRSKARELLAFYDSARAFS